MKKYFQHSVIYEDLVRATETLAQQNDSTKIILINETIKTDAKQEFDPGKFRIDGELLFEFICL